MDLFLLKTAKGKNKFKNSNPGYWSALEHLQHDNSNLDGVVQRMPDFAKRPRACFVFLEKATQRQVSRMRDRFTKLVGSSSATHLVMVCDFQSLLICTKNFPPAEEPKYAQEPIMYINEEDHSVLYAYTHFWPGWTTEMGDRTLYDGHSSTAQRQIVPYTRTTLRSTVLFKRDSLIRGAPSGDNTHAFTVAFDLLARFTRPFDVVWELLLYDDAPRRRTTFAVAASLWLRGYLGIVCKQKNKKLFKLLWATLDNVDQALGYEVPDIDFFFR